MSSIDLSPVTSSNPTILKQSLNVFVILTSTDEMKYYEQTNEQTKETNRQNKDI